MSAERPAVGEVSADGQFTWDGDQWAPLARGHREPTSWTVRLRRAVAAFFLVNGMWQVFSNALFVTPTAEARMVRATNPALADDQVRSAAQLGMAVGWVVVAILAVVMVALAVSSLRGWRWAFWVDLVV